MKVMVMIQGTPADEDKVAPSEEMFLEMGAYNEKLVAAGVMLDGQGLLPSARGARVVFQGEATSVVDGPFTEAKEIIAGYWIWQVSSLEEAVEWAKQCPHDAHYGSDQILEIRPIASMEDFGEAYTPEVREQEEQLAEKIREQHPEA